MKVLISQKVEGIAGSETYLLNLLPALNKSGVHAELLILYPKRKEALIATFKKRMESHAVTLYTLPVSAVPQFSELKPIYNVIKAGGYHLVHSNLVSTDMILAAVKFFFDRKLVLVSGKHGYEEAYTNAFGFNPTKKKRNFYWFCARFAEMFINRSYVISKGLYDLFCGLGIAKKDKLDVINYGFDFRDDYTTVPEYRYGQPQLVIVGRLTAYKGHRYALQAIQKLAPRYPDIKLVIVGWGELEGELKKMAHDLGIETNVVFTGFHPHPRDIMYTSDIVLLPSVSEGFGIVVLEAMSTKRPVVAFDVPSPSEIFTNGETGLLAPPYAVEAYTELIRKLIDNPEHRNELAQNAYQKLKGYYNLTRMVKETVSFYEKAIKST